MTASNDDYRERLAAEAQRLRDSGLLGRSQPLIRLFDFLLDRSLDDRAPKEIEVAQEVFGKGADFDMMQDASVRVYVHRLRRKLDDHYSRTTLDTDRLIIPRGEYRLALADPAGGEADELQPVRERPPGDRFTRFWIALAIVIVINLIGWGLFVASRPTNPNQAAAESGFWQPITSSPRPTFVIAGDYYIFGEAPDTLQVTRLIRSFPINSRQDLDNYLMTHPADMGRYVDVDLHYLPTSIGAALRNLIPVINTAAANSGIRPRVGTMSELTPELFKGANIVYVGFFSGLGQLRDALFDASGFKVGSSYDELIDKATGRRFSSDWGVVADGRTPRRDFGYLASLPGPSGNHILIVAGTRDAAVAQASEIAADPQQLARLAAKAGDGSFEALYEVRTEGNLNLGSTLLVARPLKTAGIWQPDRSPQQHFPDQEASTPGN